MKKRLFQVLDELNVLDGENKTETVAISSSLVSANSCKQGGLVTMGVDAKRLQQIALDGDNYFTMLIVIDKAAYEKQQNNES